MDVIGADGNTTMMGLLGVWVSSQTCWFRQQGFLGVGDRQFVARAEVVHGEGQARERTSFTT